MMASTQPVYTQIRQTWHAFLQKLLCKADGF
jgi:hypothetical protein